MSQLQQADRIGAGTGRSPRQAAAGRWRLSSWLAPLLALALLLAPAPLGPQAGALALELPGWARSATRSGAERANPSVPGPVAAGRLQEVAPPAGVRQLQEALESRQPRLSILAPTDNSLLPAGPWTLKLRIADWPLVDAGPLGLGPHLVVQLDEEPPRRLSQGAATENGDLQLELELPELTPGSHRLSVYAARPWGEAVKAPGAWRQIRVHRVLPNPLALPAPGSPQLLAVAPAAVEAGEPVLLDWLLLDAPLQHLRPGDDSWRLRISVNGDSVLVDRQTPLWLKGWRGGDNAIQLELVDLRGEPINPPFNSLVRELRLDPSLPRPAWLDRDLSARELALLLGEATPEPEPEPEPEPQPEAQPVPAQQPQAPQPPMPAAAVEAEPTQPEAAEPDSSALENSALESSDPETAPGTEPEAVDPRAADAEAVEAVEEAMDEAATPQAAQIPQTDGDAGPPPAEAASAAPPSEEPASEKPEREEPAAPAPSARAEVNPDGTLIQSGRSGPLTRLRQRLNGTT